jgi:VanZ family protein
MTLRNISAILFFLLLATLLVLTFWPDMPDVKIRIRNEWFRLDYTGHLGFYALTTVSFLLWRTGWRGKISLKMAILTIIVGIALGILTEFVQRAVPGRSFNPLDMTYNCLGVIAAVGSSWTVGQLDNLTVKR